MTVARSDARWEMFLLASMGKARTVATIFGEPTDTPLLGVAALEILGYAIDPRTRKLEPTEMLLP